MDVTAFVIDLPRRTLADIWREERELIGRLDDRRLLPYGDIQKPTREQIRDYLGALNGVYGEFVQRPWPDFDLQGTAARRAVAAERYWGVRMPQAQLVPAITLLQLENAWTDTVNRRLPEGKMSPKIDLPSAAFYSAYYNAVVVPDRYPLIRVSKNGSQVTYLPWNPEMYETVAAEEFNHAAFRNLRGEIDDGYIDAVYRQPLPLIKSASALNEAVSEAANYSMFHDPENALPLLNSRTQLWRSGAGITYSAVRALQEAYALKDIALADMVQPAVGFYLSKDHPTYTERRSKLEAASQGRAYITDISL